MLGGRVLRRLFGERGHHGEVRNCHRRDIVTWFALEVDDAFGFEP